MFQNKRDAPVQEPGRQIGLMPQSVVRTDQNAPRAPVSGHVVATVLGGGIGSAIAVSHSRRRISPVPVTSAIAMALVGVIIVGVAVGTVGRSASLYTANIGAAGAIETMRSFSTAETRRTISQVARSCARGTMARKARDRFCWRTT